MTGRPGREWSSQSRETESEGGDGRYVDRRKEEEDSRDWRGEDMTQHDIRIAC